MLNGYFVQGPRNVAVGAYNLVTSPVQTGQNIATGLGTLAGNLTYNTGATFSQLGNTFSNPQTSGQAIFNTVLALTPAVEAGIAKLGVGASDAADVSVLSGHGAYDLANGTTTIPENTSFTTWTAHGNSITDELGNAIESGSPITFEQFGDQITGARTYLPGSTVPNYTLFPPDGLNLVGNPTTVEIPTNLSDLLSPNLGNVNWAACLNEVDYGSAGTAISNISNGLSPWWILPTAANAYEWRPSCPTQ
jgi:hypothetical protein